MKITSKSLADTAGVAENVLKNLSKNKQAVVLALYGDLGSGKTTFVQEFGKLLGVKSSMQSPTFIIIKSYPLVANRFSLLCHIDAYRLDEPEELASLGWGELVKNPENIIAIEWAERVEKILPKDCVRIRFKFIDETTREIEVLQ